MGRAEELAQLRSELALLTARSQTLSQHLAAATRELEAAGRLPAVALTDELDMVRAQFADLRRATVQFAAALAEPADQPATEITSLQALDDLLGTAQEKVDREVAGQARQAVLVLLDRVLQMRHRQHAEFAPLQQCQALAAQLRQALASLEWPATHAELAPLVAGQHPLSYLVEFVEHKNELDDERWEYLHEALAETFGRSLAVAVARDKVWIAPQVGSSSAQTETEVETEGEVDEDDWPTSTLAWPEPQARGSGAPEALPPTSRPGDSHRSAPQLPESDASGPGRSGSEPSRSDRSRSDPPESPSPESVSLHLAAPESRQSPSPQAQPVSPESFSPESVSPQAQAFSPESFSPESPSLQPAAPPSSTLRSTTHTRVSATTPAVAPAQGRADDDAGAPPSRFAAAGEPATVAPVATLPVATLVWQALLRGRASAALLLATHASDDPLAPPGGATWLLRALALSPHLMYVNGDLALQLTEEFAGWDESDFGARDDADDVRRAFRLLVVAAALRPALVAPDTGAWTILRALPADGSLPNLERYSRLIADYGEHHPPLSPHTLASPLRSAAWRDALEDLLREIGVWRVRYLGMRTTFPPAAEVWRRWQRPDGVVHALLAPLTLDHQGLETARGLVERLSNHTQIEWEIADTDRRVLGRVRGPEIASRPTDASQLQARVREAVAFARRWIALQDNRPGRADDEPRRLARALREQLTALRPAVGQELARIGDPPAPLHVRAAVAQSQATVASIDALLGLQSTPEPSRWWMPAQEPPPGLLLHADLLHVPDAELDADWHVQRVDAALLARSLHALVLADEPPDWRSAFALQLRRQDHLATAQVIARIELHDPALGSELDLLRADDLELRRAHLRHEVELTRDQLDRATAAGGMDAQTRAVLMAGVEGTLLRLPHIVRCAGHAERLRVIRARLERLPEAAEPEAGPVHNGLPWRGEQGGVDDRVRARAALTAPDGPCLLVGGPALGASALLQELRESESTTGRGRTVIVVDLLGDASPETPPEQSYESAELDRFWGLLARAMTDAALMPATGAGEQSSLADELIRRIRAWLAEDDSRRLLLLVDHAEALLNAEAHAESQSRGHSGGPGQAGFFPVSSRLASLIDNSNGACKVVVAGSLAVLRTARVAGHPLAHRGYVCLGPVLDHGGWRTAEALLRRSLGRLEPESAGVVARALSLGNYEPESISRLGALLARRVPGPMLTATLLEEVVSSREGSDTLTAGLRAVLQADPRHAVLVYCLALAAWAGQAESGNPGRDLEQDQDQEHEGISREWLRQQASLWWEPGFRHAWSEDRFGELLHELLSLGAVRVVGQDRVVLATQNLVPFLGTQEDLLARLLYLGAQVWGESESEYEYPPAFARLALENGPAGSAR